MSIFVSKNIITRVEFSESEIPEKWYIIAEHKKNIQYYI